VFAAMAKDLSELAKNRMTTDRSAGEKLGECARLLRIESGVWLRSRQHNPEARLRLFCFPYAGGSAVMYRYWTDLPPEIEVCPVQLPGRDERFREPAFTRTDALCEALVRALRGYVDMPFAMFGHSMGAIIAYEFACRLQARGSAPVHLLVSGQRAPHVPLRRTRSYDLPEPAFRDRLRELDGTPEAVLQDAGLMELLLPRLRSDFEMSETYEDVKHAPLVCPITAFGGAQDKEVSSSDLEAWRLTTTSAFDLKMFPGGHFYLDKQGPMLRRHVAECLLARR
jgi:medium-chain acyl-[acyl-carrier-protein] hydrolase